MDGLCQNQIISEDYADFIFNYISNIELLQQQYEPECIQLLDWRNVMIHVPIERLKHFSIEELGYDAIPKCFGLDDVSASEAAGVNRIQNAVNYNMTGENVLVGFVDTGIDYRNKIFQHLDGESKIYSIWDQTIQSGTSPEGISYGTEYTKELIDLALKNENPLSIVPSTDENGHGTFISGIAAGRPDTQLGFSGVAVDAEIIMVKLKTAKKFTKDFFRIPDNVLCYQDTDIILGIRYIVETARKSGRPLVICMALGSSQGGHEGRATLSNYLSYIARFMGICVVAAAGNEGNHSHHFYGRIEAGKGNQLMELLVGEKEHNFSLEIWGVSPNTYSIDVLSPSGEYIPRIPARLGENREIKFLFENTILTINYQLIESQTGDQLILLRFDRPAPGLWRFEVYGEGETESSFHAWLPIAAFITEGTYFINSNPDTTITIPGNAFVPITVTAYNHKTDTLFYNASRGFTRLNINKPEIAAPGVNIFGPFLNNTYGYSSGTSISAAFVTGVAALIHEMQHRYGSEHILSTMEIKSLLIRGAKRKSTVDYPNKDWGFGILDVFESLNSLR